MPEIKNKIIVDTADAAKSLQILNRRLNAYTKAILKASAAEAKHNVTVRRAGTTLADLVGTQQRASQAVKTLAASTKQATDASRRNTDQNKKQKRASDDLGISWTTVKRIFAGQIIFRALSAITNQMRDSVGVARELEVKLAEAITIAPGRLNLSVEGMKSLGNEIRELSESFGIDQVELATAAYQVYSNQLGGAAESTEFLRTAVEFATATVTNSANAVDLLSGVINAYGLEAGEATRVSDIFTKSVELGRFRIDDISNSFGRLTPVASTLGISIEELAAAFATITIKGVSPDKAITQLLAVMLKMVKPSKAFTKALNEIGFSTIRQATSTLGLVGTLKALVATTDGTIESLGKLFPRVRGIQGVLGLAADGGERFDSVFTEIRETAKGATRTFEQFIRATESKELDRNIQSIKNLFVEDFGKAVIKIMNDVSTSMGGLPETITRAEAAMGALVVAMSAVAATKITLALITAAEGFGFATAGATAFGVSLRALPLVGLIAGAAAAGLALAFLIDQFLLGGREALVLAENIREIEKDSKNLAFQIENTSRRITTSIVDAAQEQLDAVRDSIRVQVTEYQGLADTIEFIEDEVTQVLTDQIDTRVGLYEDFADAAADAQERAAKKILTIEKKIAKERVSIEKTVFDLSIRGLSTLGKRRANARRSLALLDKATLADTIEQRLELLKTAKARANLAGSTNLIKKVGAATIEALKAEKSAIQRNADLLTQQEANIRRSVKAMVALKDEVVLLNEELLNSEFLSSDEIAKKRKEISDLIEKLGDEEEEILDKIGKALGTIVKGFDGVTFPEIKLQFDDKTQQLLNLLAQRTVPLEVTVFFKQFGLDVTTPEQAQEGLKFLEKDIEDIRVGVAANLLLLGDAFKEARIEIAKNAPTLTIGDILAADDISELKKRVGESVAAFQKVKIAVSGLKAVLESKDANKLDQLPRAAKALTEALDGLDDDAGASAKKALAPFLKILKDIGNQEGVIEGRVEDLKELNEVLGELGLGKPIFPPDTVSGVQTATAIMVEAVTGLSRAERALGPSAVTGARQATNALLSIGAQALLEIPKVAQLATALSALIALQAQAGQAVTNATGGPIPAFLAGGGPTQSRGTDTVPVQAAPGEMFINSASTRRFIPELTAINAGRAPETRNNAQTTNNSFSGDININVPAGTSVNGRTVAADIRRELRRKTSSLS